MKLQKLVIEYNEWGDNKDKFTGTIHFKDEHRTEVHVELTPEQASKYVEFSVPILMAAADNASEKFKLQLVESTLNMKQLPSSE